MELGEQFRWTRGTRISKVPVIHCDFFPPLNVQLDAYLCRTGWLFPKEDPAELGYGFSSKLLIVYKLPNELLLLYFSLKRSYGVGLLTSGLVPLKLF